MLLALGAYAAETYRPGRATYEFSFGGPGDNQGAEILNYHYGNSKMAFTSPAGWELAKGHIGQGGGVYAKFEVDTPLYVKWRVLSTGKEYEDTVDLKDKLPRNMNHKTIHFSIQGTQLNVYVVESRVARQIHAPEAKDCPILSYKMYKCTRIYPDHWANFKDAAS